MKRPGSKVAWIALTACLVLAGGCGYTSRSLLPSDIKSLHVAPVENAIDLSAEISDKEHFRVYRPGLEVDVTNAVINAFIFEGNLKITKRESADAVLEAKLVDYRRDPLRYSDDDDVQEYRLSVVIEAHLIRSSDKKEIWSDARLTGDTTFFLSGPHAVSEDVAAGRAVEDVAKRVVERTFELW